MALPSTNVPLVEPRSFTTMESPVQVIWQWKLETEACSIWMSFSLLRPTRLKPDFRGNSWICPVPLLSSSFAIDQLCRFNAARNSRNDGNLSIKISRLNRLRLLIRVWQNPNIFCFALNLPIPFSVQILGNAHTYWTTTWSGR